MEDFTQGLNGGQPEGATEDSTKEQAPTQHADPNEGKTAYQAPSQPQESNANQSAQYNYSTTSSPINNTSNNSNYNTGNNRNVNYSNQDQSVMSMGDWILTLLVLWIPCGFIVHIVWAFGSKGNENRRNFCRANLIVMAISAVLIFILYGVFFAAIMSRMGYYY